ncbi:hypothetical protein niasHS_005025 [Heterodera schachtii]|uniref:B30.2/SPRY domain-containing protein n=1 Tax=Heterodera schachtii TaxID=97005 RepID=A0ABD2JKH0_HETSC
MSTLNTSSADEFSPLQPIIPNLSTSEEMSVLIARIAELNRANTVEPSIASSADLFGQDGNGSDDNEFNLDDENGQKKEEKETPKNEVSGDQLSKILEKISEMEKQQKEQSKANSDQLSKMQNDQKILLEKISELEKEQKQKRKAFLNFRQNYWATNVCHENLQIIGRKNHIVHHVGNTSGWSSIFAKHQILLNNNSSDIFYYEISVKDKESCNFGFAVKQQNKLDGTILYEKGTYALESDGQIWINGKAKERIAKYSYGVGDTVGIGVNSPIRQIIFTKNGLRLDSADFLVASSFANDSFHPFVSLWNSGDKIEANFGPNFKLDLTTL